MRALLFLTALTLLVFAACGDGSDPPAEGSDSSSEASAAEESIPPAWRGLQVRRFRSPGPPAIEVLDLVPPAGATGHLLTATIRPTSGTTESIRVERNIVEARLTEGAWLIEWPAQGGSGPLEVQLKDDQEQTFLLRVE